MESYENTLQLDSLTVVLGAELLVALALALGLILWHGFSRNRHEKTQAGNLVARINAGHTEHINQLGGQLLAGVSDFPDAKRDQSMNALAVKENELYKHVIRAFLNHDIGRLTELDRYVHGLSEPYCQLIADLIEHLPRQGGGEPSAEAQERVGVAEAIAREAQAQAEQINQQLTLALSTLDEVSSEYTKMFNTPKSVEELNESRLRMLQAFGRTENLARQGLLPELHTADHSLN